MIVSYAQIVPRERLATAHEEGKSVVNTFPRLAPAITDQSEQCHPGVMQGQPVTNAKVGRTSGLAARASSGCPSLAASETGGFATGRAEVCPTDQSGEDRDGRFVWALRLTVTAANGYSAASAAVIR